MGKKFDHFESFREFWPFYLSQHQNPTNRVFHLVGAMLGWGVGLKFIFNGELLIGLITGLGIGYSLAWIGHFIFEKNRPATFRFPFYSFLGDLKMCFWLILKKDLQ